MKFEIICGSRSLINIDTPPLFATLKKHSRAALAILGLTTAVAGYGVSTLSSKESPVEPAIGKAPVATANIVASNKAPSVHVSNQDIQNRLNAILQDIKDTKCVIQKINGLECELEKGREQIGSIRSVTPQKIKSASNGWTHLTHKISLQDVSKIAHTVNSQLGLEGFEIHTVRMANGEIRVRAVLDGLEARWFIAEPKHLNADWLRNWAQQKYILLSDAWNLEENLLSRYGISRTRWSAFQLLSVDSKKENQVILTITDNAKHIVKVSVNTNISFDEQIKQMDKGISHMLDSEIWNSLKHRRK